MQIARMPVITTVDPAFSPASIAPATFNQPVGSRYEAVKGFDGPGTASYVPQPSRSELKANNSVFGSATRAYYLRDPEGKMFIDIDGNEVSPRWILYDPRGGQEGKGNSKSNGCVCM